MTNQDKKIIANEDSNIPSDDDIMAQWNESMKWVAKGYDACADINSAYK